MIKNKISRLKTVILLILSNLVCFNINAQTISPDSLLNRINGMGTEERLDALSRYCMGISSGQNGETELKALKIYEQEADRAGVEKHQAQARTMRIYAYYNNNMSDSLKANVGEILDFFEARSRWKEYFSCYSTCILRMHYDNNLQYAIHETEKMHEKASRIKDEYGLAMTAFLNGMTYLTMRRYSEAQQYFSEAKRYFVSESDYSQLHNLYGIEWKSLSALNRFEEIIDNSYEWEKMWDRYADKNSIQDKSILYPYYLVCLSVRAHALMEMKKYDEARVELDRAAEMVKNGDLKDIALDIWFQEEGRYAYFTGDFKKSLEYVDKLESIRLEMNNKLELMKVREARARILSELGRYKESSEIYQKIYAGRDSIYKNDLNSQLDELNSIYKIDALEQERTELRLHIFNMAILLGVVLLGICLYIIYRSSMKEKNQIIKQLAVKESESVKQVTTLMEKLPEEMLSGEEKMFLRIKNLLGDKNVLLDSSLNREQVASMLDTNHRIVSEAVKNQSGHSFMEYINGLRIDYACEVMREKGKIPVRELSDMCGFNSYTTFYRTFCSKMGMTPNEFYVTLETETENQD